MPKIHGISAFQLHGIHLDTFLQYFSDRWVLPTCSDISRYRDSSKDSPQTTIFSKPFSPSRHGPIGS